MNDTFSLLQKYTGISKYSKSEVITPQWVVSDMVDLLPQEIFNPDATFFDPAVKSGRFLIEIYYRLMNSEQMKQAFPNEQDRHKHIIEKQLFGFATSPTAATVVRKTLYDNPLSTGNIRFTSDKLTKERVQGVFNNMKFDVVIGNPPYNKGMDIDFINLGFELSTKYCVMITPAKWQTAEDNQRIASKMTYGQFRKKIVPHMSNVVFYPDCKDVFDIYQCDGICYYLIDSNNIYDKCKVTNISYNRSYINRVETRSILNRESLWNIGNEIVEYLGDTSKIEMQTGENCRYHVMTNSQLSGYDWFIPEGPRYCLAVSVIVDTKNGESWSGLKTLSFGSDDIKECESFISYINTRFVRFLVAITLSGEIGLPTSNTFRFVPAPPSGKFDHIYTDDELYKDFNLPQKYIDVIEAVIKERK